MLVFRGQFLDPVAQTDFTRRWGEVLHLPYLKQLEMPDHREVIAQGNLGKAKHALVTEQWHSDSPFMPAPPAHAILAAQVVPEVGGDTMFATNAFLSAVLLDEKRAAMVPDVIECAGVVAMRRHLNLDDFGAHPGHQAGGSRAGDEMAKVENLVSVK
jgi:alpha-ketoglutarate-dependent taurine dioxygenase